VLSTVTPLAQSVCVYGAAPFLFPLPFFFLERKVKAFNNSKKEGKGRRGTICTLN